MRRTLRIARIVFVVVIVVVGTAVAATPGGDIWVVGNAGLTMVHTGSVTRANLACPTS